VSETNRLGFTKADYLGAKSTLCTGCGHDSITNHIVSAFYHSSVSPYKVAKMSGIGCSSKTPNYFLGKSHGFNSIHGRMAPVATGAYAVRPDLDYIGVSGDGDTASIGLGSFVHMIRRNVKMIYIVENNGVYGLTKGQFSATSEKGNRHKTGETNLFENVDICSLALDVGASFVARSFSGDAKQLVTLLHLAMRHKGTAVIDVVSPCITFANHEGSTRSFDAVKKQNQQLQELGFVQPQSEIKVEYGEGEVKEVRLHDGSVLWLKKLEHEHDVHNQGLAAERLREAREKGQILTGLFYLNTKTEPLLDKLAVTSKPLSQLSDSAGELRPSKEALSALLSRFT
jgi:2-oxoglutarate/2-oxoacid ferredoxin oxidoreductase subunit beta